MLLRARYKFIMRILSIYIQQRFSFLLWIFVAIGLFVMAIPFYSWDGYSLSVIGIILFQLFLFRMGDDLFQVRFDLLKPNRVYTKRNEHKVLVKWWLFLFCFLEAVLTLVCIDWAVNLLLVVVANFVFYILLIRFVFLASVLPLVKYPALAIVCIKSVTGHLESIYSWNWVVLFLALIFLEAAFDKHFMKGVVHKMRYVKTLSLVALFIIFVRITLVTNHVI